MNLTVKGYTFKMVMPRGKSTRLAYDFSTLLDKSAHLAVLNASRHEYIS